MLDAPDWQLAKIEHQVSRMRNYFFIAPWRKDALRGFFSILN